MKDNFVNLHVHSEFSFLDGYSSVDDIAQRVQSLGQSAVALTDHGECAGHVNFEDACKKVDVKPILGIEGYLVNDVVETKANKSRERSHLCILAENQTGLRNLWTLSSLAYIKGFYYNPLIDWAMLREYYQGLIVTDGCFLANMARCLVEDKMSEAIAWGQQYLSIFGPDNFFMELHTFQYVDPSDDEQVEFNRKMTKMNQGKVEVAQHIGAGLIVVNDAHYANKDQWENHALVWAISTNQDRLGSGQTASWMMSTDEILYWMDKHGINENITRDAINNTAIIGDRCNTEIERKTHIPMLAKSKEEDYELFFDNIEKGFQKKIVDKGLDPAPYWNRIERECELIVKRDLPGYFNIVADYAQWAKKNKNMLLAAGRGSAGGSLVAYVCSINELDPLKYDLYFERFLNEGREDYPDIDLDFPQSRRQEVKDYLVDKYGADRVCAIGNFSRLHPLAAIADIARTLNIAYEDSRKIAHIIEKAHGSETEDVDLEWEEILIEKKDELAFWIKEQPLLFKHMKDLVGLIRQSGTHPSGLIISDESLIGLLPLRVKAGKLVTQFDMYTLADLGFIKFDLLGVRHLDTLTIAAEKATGQEFNPQFYYDFDEEYSDPDVWSMVAQGKTTGVMTLETPDMTKVGKQIFPQNEKDMATLVSLNRPGVTRAGMLGEYILRRNGKKPVTTPHPLMTKILRDTCGIVVYQEQVMEIVRELAGFSLVEADRVRWIMGKKHYELMKEKKEEFVQRCLDNEEFITGCTSDPQQTAEKCWQQIEASGVYSFGRAHAQGYSLVSCWGAYMKHHHFLEQMTACLITDPDNINKYIKELRKEGHRILPPDINESGDRFTICSTGVRYGLGDLKHVGPAAYRNIIENRPFDSLYDFLAKVNKRACGKRVMEVLIKIGAFDSFGSRRTLLQDYYEFRKDAYKDKSEHPPIPNFDSDEVIEMIELEIVGNYITKNPLEKYEETIEQDCMNDIELFETVELGESFWVGGIVSRTHEHMAKNGLMCFLEIEWEDQIYPITVFADAYALYRSFLVEGAPVMCLTERLKKGVKLTGCRRLDVSPKE